MTVERSHVGQGDVILKVAGEVHLDEPLRLRERLVAAAAEEGDAGEAQQRGHQGAVWHPAQAAHAALIATCSSRGSSVKVRVVKKKKKKKKKNLSIYTFL